MEKKDTFLNALKAGVPVGSVFFGALFGPVMVTGSYTINYFLNYGYRGWIFCIIYALSTGLFFWMGFEFTRNVANDNPGVNVYDYSKITRAMYGKKLCKYLCPVYELWLLLAMVLTGAATVATGGALIAGFLNTSYLVGALIMAGLNIVIAVFGAEMVRKAGTGMMFAMIGLTLLFMILVVVFHGDALMANFRNKWNPETILPMGRGAWRVFVLCCSASSWALGLGAIAQKMTYSKKACAVGGWSCGILGSLAFLFMFIALLPFGQSALGQSAPVLWVIQNFLSPKVGGWFEVVYYILLMLALVSSGAPAVFIVVNRVKTLVPKLGAAKREKVNTLIIGGIYEILVIFMAANGLNVIVGKYFQYLGYIGQVINIVPLVIIWPVLRRMGVKARIPNLKKSETEQ